MGSAERLPTQVLDEMDMVLARDDHLHTHPSMHRFLDLKVDGVDEVVAVEGEQLDDVGVVRGDGGLLLEGVAVLVAELLRARDPGANFFVRSEVARQNPKVQYHQQTRNLLPLLNPNIRGCLTKHALQYLTTLPLRRKHRARIQWNY